MPIPNQPRMLAPHELADLRQEMIASSAWMKRELERRRSGHTTEPKRLGLPESSSFHPDLQINFKEQSTDEGVRNDLVLPVQKV
jgi:hypothetical protein